MKKILCSPDWFAITRLKDQLAAVGIDSVIRNETSSSLAGEIPFNECTPELWILHDQQFSAAQEVRRDLQVQPAPQGNFWKCPGCGEELEPQFDSCWKCGAPKR